MAQLALQWVIRHPAVTSAIVGAQRPSQIDEDVGGVGWSLDPKDLEAVETLLEGL